MIVMTAAAVSWMVVVLGGASFSSSGFVDDRRAAMRCVCRHVVKKFPAVCFGFVVCPFSLCHCCPSCGCCHHPSPFVVGHPLFLCSVQCCASLVRCGWVPVLTDIFCSGLFSAAHCGFPLSLAVGRQMAVTLLVGFRIRTLCPRASSFGLFGGL